MKVKAHQADEMSPEEIRAAAEELRPNAFVVAGNKVADKEAGEARTLAEARGRRELRYCAGGERFFYSWRGRMVVSAVGKFLRQEGHVAALEEWAKRPAQGAVARAVRAQEVDGKALELGRHRKPVGRKILADFAPDGAKEEPFCPDRVLWKMRNYVGGSWTRGWRRGRAGRPLVGSG